MIVIQLTAFLWQQLPPNLLHLRFVQSLRSWSVQSLNINCSGASSSTRAMDSLPALFWIPCSVTWQTPGHHGPLLGPLSHCGTSKGPGFFQHIDAGLGNKISGKHQELTIVSTCWRDSHWKKLHTCRVSILSSKSKGFPGFIGEFRRGSLNCHSTLRLQPQGLFRVGLQASASGFSNDASTSIDLVWGANLWCGSDLLQ
jgi:hypothetical protein